MVLDHINGKTVYFSTGDPADFDAIISCTGYDLDPTQILHNSRAEGSTKQKELERSCDAVIHDR
jgi:hypothetical protein